MFKNITIFAIAGLPAAAFDLDRALTSRAFEPIGATQEMSFGWAPPRNAAFDAYVEVIGGQWIAQAVIETRSVPGNVVLERAKEEAQKIEEQTGRKPGRKEMRDLREDAKLALLPQAFPKREAVLVWLDVEQGRLVIDSATQSTVDTVVTALVDAVPGLTLRLVVTTQTPQSAMAQWLVAGEAPGAFQIERQCELKSTGEDRATVKYDNHTLDIDEVKQHIAQGKLPTKLALNWQGRVAFTLTEGMTLKKLAFLDAVFEGAKDTQADDFEADVAISTGELSKLIPGLVDALGGELTEFGTDAGQ